MEKEGGLKISLWTSNNTSCMYFRPCNVGLTSLAGPTVSIIKKVDGECNELINASRNVDGKKMEATNGGKPRGGRTL